MKKAKMTILLVFLLAISAFPVIPLVKAQGPIDPKDIKYNWALETFSAQIGRVWNNDNFLMNETGTYNEVFNYSRGYAISDTEWIEEESVFTYNVNYSYFSNLSLFGDYALDVNLDVYKVSISYGTSVSFIWVGFKNGTFSAEYNIYNVTHDFKHENSFYKKTETTYKKYNFTTMELLDAWNETIEDNGSWTSEDEPGSEYTIHQTIDMEFSMPLILTFQIYETQNGEKVAWADMISDFYIFEDIDKNGVYSVGETSVEQNMFRMTTSDELRGMFMPWAFNYTLHTDYWSPEYSSNDTDNYKFPEDKEVNYFGDSIQFTPPQLVDNEIEWDILYPDFPIFGFVQTEEDWFTSGPNYTDSSPGNYSFGYNYEITNETADLDLTARLPRLSDVDFFNIVDNLSLAFPHYTYFLSSADIEEFGNSVVTIPSDVFQFDIGGEQVAEMNMEEDKKYYSLMDYPDLGHNRTFEAIGSTVSMLVANELENISVDDYVNSKLEPINPALAYAPISSAVTYAPAQSVANLEAQMELVKYKKQTIEILDRVKELNTEIEQKTKENSERFIVKIDASEFPTDYKSFEFYIVGAPPETRFIDIPLPIDVSLIEAKLLLKSRFKYDLELLLDGQVLSGKNSYNDLELSNDMKLRLITDLSDSPIALVGAQMGARPAENWEYKLDDLRTKYEVSNTEIIKLSIIFTENLHSTIRREDGNFFAVFDRKEFFTEFLPDIKLMADSTFDLFKKGGFDAFGESMIHLWLTSAKNLDPSLSKGDGYYEQIVAEAKAITKRVEKIYYDTISLSQDKTKKISHPDEVIKQAIIIGIALKLYDTATEDGGNPYNAKRGELFDRLRENLQLFKSPKFFNLREFLTLSILNCLTHMQSFSPFSEITRKFYHHKGLDSGSVLEVFSLIEVLPQEHLWLLKNGYQLVDFDEIKLHDMAMETVVKLVKFGSGFYEAKSDHARFDISRRVYKKGDQWFVLYIPNKNTVSYSLTTLQDIAENTIRAVYETNNYIIENSLKATDFISEILLVAPFLSQDNRFNTLNNFGENFLLDLSKGIDLGTGCWQETRPRNLLKLSISDGHKYNIIQKLNYKLGLRDSYSDYNMFKEDFENNFASDDDDFTNDLYENNQAKLKDYWGIKYNDKGQKQFGLVLDGSIRMYLDTGKNVYIDDIKQFLDPESVSNDELIGIKTKLDEITGKNFIVESTVLGFKINDKGDPVYRLFNLDTAKKGFEENTEWQLGYPKISHYNTETGEITYKIIPQVVFTHQSGHRLLGRYGQFVAHAESGVIQLIDNNEKWYMDEEVLEKNILTDYRNIQYGLNLIFYELNRHGDAYNIIGHTMHLTSMKLKFGIYREYNADRFKDDSYISRPRSKLHVLPKFSFLRQFPIPDNIKTQIANLKELILKPIEELVQFQLEHKGISNKPSTLIDIDPAILKVLNAYEDENGGVHLGNGYKELEFIFKYLFKEKSKEVCFINFKGAEHITHIFFNLGLSDKQWLEVIFESIFSYTPPASLDSNLQSLSDKILIYKALLNNKFPKGFSEGLYLKQYSGFIDELLAKQLIYALIDIIGRFTYSRMITGSIYHDGRRVNFITPSWKSYRIAFEHNQRLSLNHFESTKNNLPPGAVTHPGSFSFILDNYIFGPTFRLKVIREVGGQEKNAFIDCPHIPTDYWNPAYLSFSEISITKLTEYTNHLSNWLLHVLGRKVRASIEIVTPKSEGTRMFLNVLFDRFKENVLRKVESHRLQVIYSYLIESALYKLLFLGKSSDMDKDRKQIKSFLNYEIDRVTIDLKLKSIPADLRSIELDHTFRVLWSINELNRIFYKSLRIKVRTVNNLQAGALINSLEEPITRFGRTIKDMALLLGNPSVGSPEKVYLIPTIQYPHGIGQRTGTNQYIDAACDSVLIDDREWLCWELDGTNNGENLGLFKNKYEKVIRGLLEGHITLFIFAVDKDGNYRSIGALNILQGALLPSDLYFSTQNEYRIFNSIDSFDSDFYKEISVVMNYFKKYALPLLPVSLAEDPYFVYRQYPFIYDFF